jgi:hypothetical protein
VFKKKKKEETSNFAVQQCYGIDDTNVRWWKKQKEQLYMAQRVMLCGRTMIRDCQMMTLVTEGLVKGGRQF